MWKAAAALRTKHDVDCATYDSDWGFGVVIPRPNSSLLICNAEDLNWQHFNRDKRTCCTMDYCQIMDFILQKHAAQERGAVLIGPQRVRHERHVLRAFYGQGERTIDVTGVIKTFVAHKCYEFVASNALGGDPCCNVVKSLKILFDDGYAITHSEGEMVSLEPILMHLTVR